MKKDMQLTMLQRTTRLVNDLTFEDFCQRVSDWLFHFTVMPLEDWCKKISSTWMHMQFVAEKRDPREVALLIIKIY